MPKKSERWLANYAQRWAAGFVLGVLVVGLGQTAAYANDKHPVDSRKPFTLDDLAKLVDQPMYAQGDGAEVISTENVVDTRETNKALQQLSNWRLVEEVSPLDDARIVQIQTDAISGEGLFGSPISLVVRCSSNSIEAFIDWNRYVGNDGPDINSAMKHVTVRFGKNIPVVETMDVSTNKQATFFRQKHLRRHLEIMALHDTFVAQVYPYAENPTTAVFNVSSMDIALSRIWGSCDR